MIVSISAAMPAADSRWPMLDFDRADVHGPGSPPRSRKPVAALDLDRVAQRRARAAGFDIADAGGVDLGDRVRLGDDVGPASHRRRGVRHLGRTVVVERAEPRITAWMRSPSSIASQTP